MQVNTVSLAQLNVDVHTDICIRCSSRNCVSMPVRPRSFIVDLILAPRAVKIAVECTQELKSMTTRTIASAIASRFGRPAK
jgi:hypothetical protein